MNSNRLPQIRGVLRLELRKNLLSTRALPMYMLAALPLAVIAIFILVSTVVGRHEQVDQPPATLAFAYLYQILILRGVVYFGCVWLFMNLFRGEVLDRSLHYYFLAPLRRDLLVAGKYVSAWLTTTLLFAGTTAVSYVALYGFLSGTGLGGALSGTSLAHLLAYMGVTTLGCLGYGAVFLLVGLFIRNPILPAVGIFLWEGINGLLPTLLKKISVIHYLHSLMPVPADQGPLAIVAEPVSVWFAVPGLILFTGLTMFIASLRIRHMEIAYSSD